MGMTRKEFAMLVKGMKAVYATETFIADEDAFNTWYALLSDLEYQIASVAVQNYMRSNHFAPAPADIIDCYMQLVCETEHTLNEKEAWRLVYDAICKSGYNSVEEFEKLPPLVQKAVGSPGQLRAWGMDEDFNEGVESSNFGRVYRAEVLRAREYAKMPAEVQRMIDTVTQNSPRAELERRNQALIDELHRPKIEETRTEGIPCPEEIKAMMD